ncbi:F-box protein SKIP28 [Euphorbia lathyris]|uniref:F-box protein SKIP28 n=1 Tax=Euphorbia lathyris TaxID=212925 RepID=UPI003313AB69
METVIESVSGAPHDAFFLVLPYLPLYHLLTIGQVCKSFREALNQDILPWLHLIIDIPLSPRLSDQILIKLTSKANSRLTTLVLRNCARISDDGLLRVIHNNPLITKLHLPGCTSLTPEGIIRAVETLSQNKTSLNSLRINGIPNLNKHHLQTLSSYLQTSTPPEKSQPILYHLRRTFPSESDGLIDVDVCPRCQEIKMVFECSREGCRQKKRAQDQVLADCRGCNLCIPRCEECGGCIDSEEELEEAVCSDILCRDCWLSLPKCNHCNKPYCKHHTNLQYSSLDCAGFVCETCHFQATTNSSFSSDAAE